MGWELLQTSWRRGLAIAVWRVGTLTRPLAPRRGRFTTTDQLFSSSTFRPSERISLTSTLKLSGMPASKLSSPRTIAS